MAGANTQTFTDGNFDQEVLQSPVPVLVDFWAEWCAPCKALGPTIDQLADEYVGKVKIGKVDTDANREISTRYQVSAIPTVLLFKDGTIKEKFVGLRGKKDFKVVLDAMS
jgi:thioredoxin 1